ncbi:conserved hypothetical protein [Pyrobaculum islandicum DSM 4184]|uniref:Transcriptional regulator, MarR family n=1 Tax=Pyrobaculum islandicum (strain DSM 4184 / JCM 9189 / GEO3) TaxID=384616 RepID=A1RUT2_PYRIL|nr:hypothetical protein [Pyrobaculum islandicum]ABL88714.1 conserved hypothetical protein [Pyrobaculum islandicum DSM 4184]
MDERAVLEKLDKFLHTVRYDGFRVLFVLYFVNQRIKWADFIDTLDYGYLGSSFYMAALRLEKLGLVQRKRLDIKTFVRITDKGRKLVECLMPYVTEQ